MKNKQLFINMVATIIAFLINTGISFFLTPYITNSIGTEAYGFISLANNFVMYASLVTIALNSMAGRFITIKIHQNKMEEANKYFTSILIANVFFTIVLFLPSALLVFFLDDILTIPAAILLDVKILFIFIFLNFFISIINATYATSTFVKNRLDLSSKVNIISYIIKMLLLLLLFAFFIPKVSYVGFTSCMVSIFALIMNIHYTKKLLPELSIKRKYLELKKILEIIKSGIWNTVTKLGQILSDGLDLLITNIFITPTAMGQLAIVKTITTCLSSFISTFSGVFHPQQTIDYAKGDVAVVVEDIKFSMKLTSVVSNIPYVFLIVFGYAFYKLWVPEVDTNLLSTLSSISIISQLTLASIVPLWQIFTITNKLKVNSLVTVGSGLLCVLIVFILLQITDLGVIAVAGVSSIVALVKNITYTPIYSAHCLGVNKRTFYPEIFRNIFVTSTLLGLNFCLAQIVTINTWLDLFIVLFISCSIGLIVNYSLMFNKEEKKDVFIIFKKIIKKFPLLDKFVWKIRTLFRNLLWYYYGFYKIENKKIVIDNFNGNGYGDNPKYIVEELLKRDSSYDIVCTVSKNNLNTRNNIPNNIRTVVYESKEWVKELSTAKVWIGNTRKCHFYRKRKNQLYIQTWHGGIAPKYIEKDAEEQLDKKYVAYAKKDSLAIDLLISDSRWQTEMFRRAFWYNGTIIESGLPRNDKLLDVEFNQEVKEKYDKYFNLDSDVVKILYAPTFRKNMNVECFNLNFDEIVESFEKYYKKKAVILIKLHPNMMHLSNKIKYNVKVLDANKGIDTQTLEIYSDVLITDYSSMMFEFLLMNKPCYLHAYDYDNYIKERMLHFNLQDLPFPFSKTEKELKENVQKFDKKLYHKKVKAFLKNEKIVATGTASKEIADIIEREIKNV